MAKTTAGLKFVKTDHGSPPVIAYFPVTISTAYKEGGVARISATTGSAQKQVATGTAILGVIADTVALANVSNSTRLGVYVDPGAIFEVKMLASSTPQTKVGDLVDLAVSTTYNYRLSGSAASTKVFKIVGFNPNESLSAHTGVRYWVKIAKPIWGANVTEAKG